MNSELICGIDRDVYLTVVGLITGSFVGFVLGLKANYIVGQVFEFRAIRSHALIETLLFSGKMTRHSGEYGRIPKADQSLHICAHQMAVLRQTAALKALSEVAGEISAKMKAASNQEDDIDYENEKAVWVKKVEDLNPVWWPFIFRKKR